MDRADCLGHERRRWWAWWPVLWGSRSCGRRGSSSRSTRRQGSPSCSPGPSSWAWPGGRGARRGRVPGVVRHRWVRGQRGAAEPGRPGRNDRGHRHLDPDDRCAHRPDRGGDRHTDQLPQTGSGSAMRPRCGSGATNRRLSTGGSSRSHGQPAAAASRSCPSRSPAPALVLPGDARAQHIQDPGEPGTVVRALAARVAVAARCGTGSRGCNSSQRSSVMVRMASAWRVVGGNDHRTQPLHTRPNNNLIPVTVP